MPGPQRKAISLTTSEPFVIGGEAGMACAAPDAAAINPRAATIFTILNIVSVSVGEY
jgi:hypothetical protein